MAQHVDKVVVTNLSALKAKYGSGLKAIKSAITKLIAADKARGLTTKLIDVASAAQMKKYKGKKVDKATDPKQNKSAIDKIYAALTPDYIVLLGAVDVIPHQDLVNPVFAPSPDGDPDQTADSDLPYACEHAYSRQIEDFTAPTRVVGRLPDLTGGDDPAYLVGLLDVAANYTSLAKDEFTDYLGITALVWQGSTKESLKNVFGSAADMKKSPLDGRTTQDAFAFHQLPRCASRSKILRTESCKLPRGPRCRAHRRQDHRGYGRFRGVLLRRRTVRSGGRSGATGHLQYLSRQSCIRLLRQFHDRLRPRRRKRRRRLDHAVFP
jgi:hypothetical protein